MSGAVQIGMLVTANSLTSVRELDCRASASLQVRLLWREQDNSVWVSVIDLRSGAALRVRVEDGSDPSTCLNIRSPTLRPRGRARLRRFRWPRAAPVDLEGVGVTMRVPAVVDSLGASSSGMRIPIAWDDPVLRRADQLWPECWPVIVEEGGVRFGSVGRWCVWS